MFNLKTVRRLLLLIFTSLPSILVAQNLPALEEPAAQAQLSNGPANAHAADPVVPPSAPVTIPAGTHIMMVLTSPLHSTSGSAGSGVYLETLYPIIQDNKIVIPARTQVQGTVESNKRPGHFQRTAEFRFQFTTLIFPNNHVATINGALQSVPGSKTTRMQRSEGTLRTVDQTEKVITPVAAGGATGALFGSVSHFGIGKFVGAGLGAGLGLGGVLLRRGDEIKLPIGVHVEMVLASPLLLEQGQVAANAHWAPARETRSVESESRSACSADGQLENPKQRRSTRALPRLPWPGSMLFPDYDLR